MITLVHNISLPRDRLNDLINTDAYSVRYDLEGSLESWSVGCQTASEYLSRCLQSRISPGFCLANIPDAFIRRRYSLSELATTEMTLSWGTTLLASYWATYPNDQMLDTVSSAIINGRTILQRGAAWRILNSIAVALPPSPLDEMLNDVFRGDNIGERRRRFQEFAQQAVETDLSSLLTLRDHVDPLPLTSIDDCKEAMRTGTIEQRQKAVFFGQVRFPEGDIWRNVVSVMREDQFDDVAVVAGTALEYVYFATEHPSVCQQLIEIVRSPNLTIVRKRIAFRTLLSCCGLQRALRPRSVTNEIGREFDLSRFEDLSGF